MKLNRELDRTAKLLSEKIAAANAWAARYFELLDLVSEVKRSTPQLTHAEKLIKAGKLDAASKLLGELIHREKDTIEAEARLFFLKGQVEDVALNLEEAVRAYERAEQLSPNTSTYSYAYASALWRNGQKQEARLVYEKAIESLLQHLPDEKATIECIRFRNALGTLLRVMEEPTDAIKQLEQSERLSMQLFGSNPAHAGLFADTLTRIGDLFKSLGVFGPAIQYYQRAIELQRKRMPRVAEAPTITRLLNAIGRSYVGLLMFDEADKSFTAAIQLLQSALPEDPGSLHIDLADTLVSLGDIYRSSDPEKAERIYLSADQLFHRLLGQSNKTTVINTVNNRLSALYLERGDLINGRKYAEAEVSTYRLLFKQQSKAYSDDLGRSLMRLALISKAQHPEGQVHCNLAREAQSISPDWKISIGFAMLGCPNK